MSREPTDERAHRTPRLSRSLLSCLCPDALPEFSHVGGGVDGARKESGGSTDASWHQGKRVSVACTGRASATRCPSLDS